MELGLYLPTGVIVFMRVLRDGSTAPQEGGPAVTKFHRPPWQTTRTRDYSTTGGNPAPAFGGQPGGTRPGDLVGRLRAPAGRKKKRKARRISLDPLLVVRRDHPKTGTTHRSFDGGPGGSPKLPETSSRPPTGGG